MTDLTLQDHGTIFLIRAQTPAGRAWIEEATRAGEFVSRAALPNHVGRLVTDAVADGLSVEVS